MLKKYQINIDRKMKGYVFITEKPEMPGYRIASILFIHIAISPDETKSPDMRTELYKIPTDDMAIVEDLVTKLGYSYEDCVCEVLN